MTLINLIGFGNTSEEHRVAIAVFLRQEITRQPSSAAYRRLMEKTRIISYAGSRSTSLAAVEVPIVTVQSTDSVEHEIVLCMLDRLPGRTWNILSEALLIGNI